MNTKISIFFALYFWATSLGAADAERLFKAANQAFQSEKFELAIESYEKIVAEGIQSKEVYFNLGNSYYENKQIGKAILNYERALKISSKDPDIKYNLEIANDQIQNAVNKVPGFFLYDWWRGARSIFSSTGWSWLAIIFVWGGIIGIVFWILGISRQQKKRGFLYGLTFLILSALPLTLAYQSYKLEQNSRMGVILDNALSVLSAPDERSSEVLKVYEGTKIEMIDQIDTWYKVRLMNGDQGWLKKGTFEWI